MPSQDYTWTVHDCKKGTSALPSNDVTLKSTSSTSSINLCRAIFSNVVPNTAYSVTAEYYIKIGNVGLNSGHDHPGMMFNIKDGHNFDIVFFRYMTYTVHVTEC